MIDPSQFLQDDQMRKLIERTAEREALKVIHVTSFSDCLKQQSLQPDLVVIGAKGKQLTLRGRDIVNARVWTRFVAEKDLSLGGLAYRVGEITLHYVRWLRTDYTPRYRAVASDEALTWLTEVAKLAALWHLMQHKYEMHRFCDEWCEAEMRGLVLHRQFSQESMRAVNHGRKHQEDAVAALVALKEHFDAQLHAIPFVPYEELPALPEGMPDPLALPPGIVDQLLLPPPPSQSNEANEEERDD